VAAVLTLGGETKTLYVLFCVTDTHVTSCHFMTFTESQNHRLVGVGRDLCGSPSPTPWPKQGHLQQAAQDLVQVGLSCTLSCRSHQAEGRCTLLKVGTCFSQPAPQVAASCTAALYGGRERGERTGWQRCVVMWSYPALWASRSTTYSRSLTKPFPNLWIQ